MQSSLRWRLHSCLHWYIVAMGREATFFYKRLAYLLSTHWGHPCIQYAKYKNSLDLMPFILCLALIIHSNNINNGVTQNSLMVQYMKQ